MTNDIISCDPSSEFAKSLVIIPEIRGCLRQLDDEERLILAESIAESCGARDPLTVWNDPFLGMVIVDGINRYEICMEKSLPFDVSMAEFDGVDDAVDWAINNQLGRRNLQASERARLVLLRNQKDSEGNTISVRQAAKIAGVSIGTMHREKAKVAPTPKPVKAEHVAPTWPEEVLGERAPADVWGQPIPEALRELFGAEYQLFQDVLGLAKKLRRSLSLAQDKPVGGQRYRAGMAYQLADDMVEKLDGMTPYCVCPSCAGSGLAINAPTEACFPCTGFGWVSEEQLKRFPKLTIEKLEALKGEVYGECGA